MLEVSIDDPGTIGTLTLYFRSGGGWYASHKPIATKGWQTLRFSKAALLPRATLSAGAKSTAFGSLLGDRPEKRPTIRRSVFAGWRPRGTTWPCSLRPGTHPVASRN